MNIVDRLANEQKLCKFFIEDKRDSLRHLNTRRWVVLFVRLINMNERSPGKVLLEELLQPLDLSVPKLAQLIQVPPNRLYAIINGTREISADTAYRLGTFFETGAEFWLVLQQRYNQSQFEVQLKNVSYNIPNYTEWKQKENLRVQ